MRLCARQVSLSVNLPLFDALNMFKDFPEAVQGAIAAIMSPVVVCYVTPFVSTFWARSLNDSQSLSGVLIILCFTPGSL